MMLYVRELHTRLNPADYCLERDVLDITDDYILSIQIIFSKMVQVKKQLTMLFNWCTLSVLDDVISSLVYRIISHA